MKPFYSLWIVPVVLVLIYSCDVETVDSPASELEVKILLSDPEQYPPDEKVLLSVQFFLDGIYVKLPASVEVRCNETILTLDKLGGLAYVDRVPIKVLGESYIIYHERQGVTSSIEVPVQSRPVISNISEYQSFTRQSNFIIEYVHGSGDFMSGYAYGPKANAGTIGVTGGDQPDDGTYSGLNTLEFDAGQGRVTLSRELTDIPFVHSGFSLVSCQYNSGSRIIVTWN